MICLEIFRYTNIMIILDRKFLRFKVFMEKFLLTNIDVFEEICEKEVCMPASNLLILICQK